MKITRAFVVTSEPIELEDGDRLTNSVIYGAAGYIPPLFRRTRLKRFATYARRWHLVRDVWRWAEPYSAAPPYLLTSASKETEA